MASALSSIGLRIAVSRHFPPGWEGMRFFALDFETTGLDPARERVVEIGLFGFDPRGAEGRDGEPFLSSLVNPGIPIPPEVIAIHGITDADVKDAPGIAQLLPAIADMIGGAVLVAHNAPFDLGFLRKEAERAAFRLPEFAAIDTRYLAKDAFPGLANYKLGTVARALGIDSGNAHRALDDARCSAGIVRAALRAAEQGKKR